MKIEEILNQTPDKVIEALKVKQLNIPPWDVLIKEYDPKKHPVMDKSKYPDKPKKGGGVEEMTRIMIPDQQLYAKRMASLCVGTPVYRDYQTGDDPKLKEIADVIEAVLMRNRINAINVERLKKLFAGCEIATIWYSIEQTNPVEYAGKKSPNKIRSITYSPMDGAAIYPLFDEYDDMIALSIGYTRKVQQKDTQYFDVYTATEVRHYIQKSGETWELDVTRSKKHTLGKISASYTWRPIQIWEDTSNITYEKEWILSRTGNYVRHNSAPNKVLTTDSDMIDSLKESIEKDKSMDLSRDWVLPQNSSLNIVEWQGATEAAKFEIDELSKQQDRVLQIPDLSFNSLSNISTETMRIALQDAQMKVTDESGRLTEFFDREISVIKEHIKPMFTPSEWGLIDSLVVRSEVIPYQINDEVQEANKLAIQTGNKAFVSQKEAVRQVFGADKAETIIKELEEQEMRSFSEPTI